MEDLNLFLFLYPTIAILSILGIIFNRERYFYKLIALILLIISMFRFDFQYDYFWYWIVGDKTLIKHTIIKKLYSNLEYGVAKIYDIVRWLGNPQYFFIITSLVIMGLILYTFFRDTRNPLIAITLFLFIPIGFLANNEFIMQALAGSIIFFSTRYIYEKKYFLFIVNILIVSFLFHSSAILCLIFLFIPNFKIKEKYILFIIIIFIPILKFIFPIIIKNYFSNYYYLLYKVKYLKETNLFNLKILGLLLLVIIFLEKLKEKIGLSFLLNKDFKLNKYEVYQKNIFIIGYLGSLVIYFLFEGDLSRRIGFYFYYFAFLVAGNYINIFQVKFLKFIKISIIFLCLLIRIFAIYKNDMIYLNKKPYINENGDLNARPNSAGLRLYFGKGYNDMSPYLPGEKKFNRQIKKNKKIKKVNNNEKSNKSSYTSSRTGN